MTDTEQQDRLDADGDGVWNDTDCLPYDPSVQDESTYYPDNDGDGFGDGPGITACTAPDGHAAVDGDCNDSNAQVSPQADELCDGIDNDCDSMVDDADGSVIGVATYYADTDGDAFGDPGSSTDACVQPPSHVDDDTDCDDTTAAVHPGASEVCGNGIDDDCVEGDALCITFSYTPSNVDPGSYTAAGIVDFTDCTGVFQFDTTAGSYSTDWGSCTATPTPELVTVGSGQAYVVPVDSFTVPEETTVDFFGTRPVILLAYGDISVSGTLNAGAVSREPGPGGGAACDGGVGQAGQSASVGAGGGGGALGELGGHGGQGGDGSVTGGAPGTPEGDGSLEPLRGGCPGGDGGQGSTTGGAGGAGGGALQVTAAGAVQVTQSGVLRAGGGGGEGAQGPGAGGGGGGSGGAILLEGDSLVVHASAVVEANGGGGGGGGKRGGGGTGGDGREGDAGGSGGAGPGAGGAGGDGGVLGGESGIIGEEGGVEGGGGGGGGSVGSIRLRGDSSCTVSTTGVSPTPFLDCP